MKKNYIPILVIVLLVLMGLYFITSSRRGTGTIRTPRGLVVSADSASISQIELYLQGDTIAFQLQNDMWMMTKPVHYPAEQHSVISLVNEIANARLDVEISSDADRHEEYNVDRENGRYLRVTDIAGNTFEYWVGKIGPAGMSYIRFDGDRRVWLLNSRLASVIRRDANDYREKLVLSINPDEIQAVFVESPERNFYMALEDDRWLYSDIADGDRVKPDSGKVVAYKRTLQSIRTQNFLDDSDSIAQISFDEPDYTARIMLKTGEQHNIQAVLHDDRQYVVRIDGQQEPLYLINKGVLDRLARDREYMTTKEEAPPPPPGGGVQQIGGPGGQQMTPEMQRQIQEAMQRQQMQGG